MSEKSDFISDVISQGLKAQRDMTIDAAIYMCETISLVRKAQGKDDGGCLECIDAIRRLSESK